jgi:hypothetical protein
MKATDVTTAKIGSFNMIMLLFYPTAIMFLVSCAGERWRDFTDMMPS